MIKTYLPASNDALLHQKVPQSVVDEQNQRVFQFVCEIKFPLFFPPLIFFYAASTPETKKSSKKGESK